jgi:hypothetical protein
MPFLASLSPTQEACQCPGPARRACSRRAAPFWWRCPHAPELLRRAAAPAPPPGWPRPPDPPNPTAASVRMASLHARHAGADLTRCADASCRAAGGRRQKKFRLLACRWEGSSPTSAAGMRCQAPRWEGSRLRGVQRGGVTLVARSAYEVARSACTFAGEREGRSPLAEEAHRTGEQDPRLGRARRGEREGHSPLASARAAQAPIHAQLCTAHIS